MANITKRSLIGEEGKLSTRRQDQSSDPRKETLRLVAFLGLVALTALPLQLALSGRFSCSILLTPGTSENVQMNPLQQAASRVQRKEDQQHMLPSLTDVAGSFINVVCPEGINKAEDLLTSTNTTSTRIPRVIHQTSRSRCLPERLLRETKKWQQLGGFSYFFHDDDAMQRLFELSFDEFPHLRLALQSCILSGTIKADLWRYLVLWHYGGFYADIDAIPGPQFLESLSPDDDAFFVVETYEMLSQYFLATSPRHPLIFYTIHISLLKLLHVEDTIQIPIPMVSGPHALHAGFLKFASASKSTKIAAGSYTGMFNRSITVVAGAKKGSNDIVLRESVNREVKQKAYEAMGMKHFKLFQKEGSAPSCFDAMLNATL